MILIPNALLRELGVEYGIVDRAEVTLGADLGINRAALHDARRIDLPCRIVGEYLRGPWSAAVSPPKAFGAFGSPLKGIAGAAQHRFDADQILERHR